MCCYTMVHLQDGTASAFVPHNADSAELIHIATGHSITSASSAAATQLLDAPDSVEDDEGQLLSTVYFSKKCLLNFLLINSIGH